MAFRNKGKLNINLIQSLAKQMGFVINKNLFSDLSFKSRETTNLVKEKLIFSLCKVMNESNAPEGLD